MIVFTFLRSFLLYFLARDFFNALKVDIAFEVKRKSLTYTLTILILSPHRWIRMPKLLFIAWTQYACEMLSHSGSKAFRIFSGHTSFSTAYTIGFFVSDRSCASPEVIVYYFSSVNSFFLCTYGAAYFIAISFFLRNEQSFVNINSPLLFTLSTFIEYPDSAFTQNSHTRKALTMLFFSHWYNFFKAAYFIAISFSLRNDQSFDDMNSFSLSTLSTFIEHPDSASTWDKHAWKTLTKLFFFHRDNIQVFWVCLHMKIAA